MSDEALTRYPRFTKSQFLENTEVKESVGGRGSTRNRGSEKIRKCARQAV